MSKLPISRTIAPVSLAASSRNTAVSAASVAVLVSVRPSSFHSRPHFHRTGGPGLGHLERLVQILDLNDGEPADDLLGLDERAVRDDGSAVIESDGRSGFGPFQLLTADDLAFAAVFVEPPLSRFHAGGQLIRRHVLEPFLVFHGPDEKQHVFHNPISSTSTDERRGQNS